mmetsp:Transcript_823/g.1558  ORF Transcript_823/g.1558 Transcript_823/m.1558 type:complete len:140 (+) Transcript_823:195-614(+)
MKDTFDGKSSGEGRIPRGKKGPNIHVGYEGQSAWRKVQLLSRTATTRSRRRLEGRWLHVQALPHEAWMKDPRMRYTCRKRTKSNVQEYTAIEKTSGPWSQQGDEARRSSEYTLRHPCVELGARRIDVLMSPRRYIGRQQ